jgi:hypothetical protein
MYGLPANVDLSFLKGKELQCVTMVPFQAILRFDGGVSLSITGETSHWTSDGAESRYSDTLEAAATLVRLVRNPIVDAAREAPGTLVLTFENAEVLRVYDSEAPYYESYQIEHPNGRITV